MENIESLPLDKVPENLKKGSGSLKIGSADLSGAIIGGHKESSLNSEDAAKKKYNSLKTKLKEKNHKLKKSLHNASKTIENL